MDIIIIVKNGLYALTALGDIILIVLLLGTLLSRYLPAVRKPFVAMLKRVFSGRDAAFATIVAFLSMTGSLFFSEVAHYAPCVLCWYQRIAMYPLVVVVGLEMFQKEARARTHAIVLSVIGAAVAGYPYLLQIGVIPPAPCSNVDPTSCAHKYSLGLGYITIPMMAFTAFLMIIAFLAIGRYLEREKQSNA